MAKDPVCGMYVEEKPDSIGYTVDGKEYYFCSSQCLNEFREPEKELKKLRIHVAASIANNFLKLAAYVTGTIWTFFSVRAHAYI
jgi:YHS domain-containing protein